MDAHGGGVHGQDPWVQRLRDLIDAEAEPASLQEAVRPLAALGIDVAAVLVAAEAHLTRSQTAWLADDWRFSHPDFPTKYALVIYVYTLHDPNVFQPLGAVLHDTADRAQGQGGVSANVRACLPFTKLLEIALAQAAITWGFFVGQTFRGVRWAFPDPSAHDPETHFPPGRELRICEFRSSSTIYDVMYQPQFCGRSGPRTTFTIQSCEGVKVNRFSAFPNEDEVLFPVLAHFRVTGSSKRLQLADLGPNPPAQGGFPDDIQLMQLPSVPEGMPLELLLRLDFAHLDGGAPIGHGACADVIGGTYAFPSQAQPSAVAFKVYRNSVCLSAALRRTIMAEARLGLRLEHPNLVNLYGVLEIPQRGIALVLELCTGGSLRSVLEDTLGHPELSLKMRLDWMIGISEGVKKLHGLLPRAVVHRDIKSANVLLTSRDLATAIPMLCDFGVATIAQTLVTGMSAAGGGIAGTLAWQSPETFRGRFSEASDVFGLAVTDFEILTRQIPWAGRSHQEILRLAGAQFEYNAALFQSFQLTADQQRDAWLQQFPFADRRPDLTAAGVACPPDLTVLLQRCWADDPAERPTVVERLLELRRIRALLEPAAEYRFEPIGEIVEWTVPDGVVAAKIEVWGAQGGCVNGISGGYGVHMSGQFTLLPGQTLNVLVGLQPDDSDDIHHHLRGGGGGGGTFVVRGIDEPLLIAGGGGGACKIYPTQGLHASVGADGVQRIDLVQGRANHTAGTSGHGGDSDGHPANGCSGGGFLSDGKTHGSAGHWRAGTAGQSFMAGGMGGEPRTNGGPGGFGCAGAGGGDGGGGGGGGYSGGGGTPCGGCGGGSLNAGSGAFAEVAEVGGSGKVIITCTPSAVHL